MKTYTTDSLANEFAKTTSQIRKIMAAINHIHPNPESLSTKVGRSLEISQEGHDQIALYLSVGDDGYRETHGKTFDRTSTEPGGGLSVSQESGALGQATELPTEINQEDGFEINQSVIEGRTKAIREVALKLEESQVYEDTKSQLLNAIGQQKSKSKLSSATSLFADVIQRQQSREKGTQVVRTVSQDNNELLKALGLGK